VIVRFPAGYSLLAALRALETLLSPYLKLTEPGCLLLYPEISVAICSSLRGYAEPLARDPSLELEV
jgi:hypothetical protein|tara:strand:- start:239 stop:436 length:198 start_codon:yes stop_codon:yes gene_type:complete